MVGYVDVSSLAKICSFTESKTSNSHEKLAGIHSDGIKAKAVGLMVTQEEACAMLRDTIIVKKSPQVMRDRTEIMSDPGGELSDLNQLVSLQR